MKRFNLLDTSRCCIVVESDPELTCFCYNDCIFNISQMEKALTPFQKSSRGNAVRLYLNGSISKYS
ncbi:hypothetical protein CsatB_028032 [Cannabis sativa]